MSGRRWCTAVVVSDSQDAGRCGGGESRHHAVITSGLTAASWTWKSDAISAMTKVAMTFSPVSERWMPSGSRRSWSVPLTAAAEGKDSLGTAEEPPRRDEGRIRRRVHRLLVEGVQDLHALVILGVLHDGEADPQDERAAGRGFRDELAHPGQIGALP